MKDDSELLIQFWIFERSRTYAGGESSQPVAPKESVITEQWLVIAEAIALVVAALMSMGCVTKENVQYASF